MSKKVINYKKYPVITVFLIIGMILTPALDGALFGYIINTPAAYLGFILGLYAIAIPIGIISIKVTNNAICKRDVIAVGILSLIFVSLIAGIFILAFKFGPDDSNEIVNKNSTKADLLLKYKKLYDKKAISKKEYLEKKKELL